MTKVMALAVIAGGLLAGILAPVWAQDAPTEAVDARSLLDRTRVV